MPEYNAVPPVAAAYQATEPPAGVVADKVTTPVPHLDEASADGAVGIALMMAVTAVRMVEAQVVVLFTDST